MFITGVAAMYIKRICLTLIAAGASSVFAANSVTLYRDGTLFQQEAVALKGVVDLPLAAEPLERTLTIVPSAGTTILGVETVKKESGDSLDKELEALTEQRQRLDDRLQALEAREAIFTTAAKSQSGKAPRKTKTNPEPLQAIRQGTDFAIAQLEAVYTARRKTSQEIRKIDARLAIAKKRTRPSTTSLRVMVSPAHGRVTLRYATAERGWLPQYNLYLAKNGEAELQLSAQIKGRLPGHQTRVSPGLLAEYTSAKTVPAQTGNVILDSYRLPLINEQYTEGMYHRFSGTLTNSSTRYLPAGDSGLYRDGSYMGTFRFEGISSGRSRVIVVGQ